jgi:nicotinate-nucleotide pyrophosphorylase (carboxylating)
MTDLSAMSLEQLREHLVSTGLVRRLIELAREEDLGAGKVDRTSLVCVGAESAVEAKIVARGAGVAAGLAFVGKILDAFAPAVLFHPLVDDGERFKAGQTLGTLYGSRRQILGAERTILNLLGRLCGVATRTALFVEAMEIDLDGGDPPSKPLLLDTRKTTPGLRVFEKYAVRCGGGHCHRMGLFDAVLIKDNHLAGIAPGDVGEAVARAARLARACDPAPAFVEVEADTLGQVRSFLAIEPGLIDIVLLDNMEPDVVREAIALRDEMNSGVLLEASGGITLETIGAIAATGVDRISCGSLTHGAVWVDIGLDIGEDIVGDLVEGFVEGFVEDIVEDVVEDMGGENGAGGSASVESEG